MPASKAATLPPRARNLPSADGYRRRRERTICHQFFLIVHCPVYADLGNQIIISGRRTERLQATIEANPDMRSVALNVTDPADIKAAADKLIADYL